MEAHGRCHRCCGDLFAIRLLADLAGNLAPGSVQIGLVGVRRLGHHVESFGLVQAPIDDVLEVDPTSEGAD